MKSIQFFFVYTRYEPYSIVKMKSVFSQSDFLVKFSVALLHLGYSSLAVYHCRVVFVLILLSVLKNLPPLSRLALRCQKF